MRYTLFVLLIFFSVPGNAQSPGDSAITFDAVNVEAYQVNTAIRLVPGSISFLTLRDIKGGDRTTLYNTLNIIPGVDMQSGTLTTNRIVIRGMGSRTPYNTNRIRFYLNDIPLTSSDGLSSPEEIETENLGRIELIKGPSSALYGSGLGGSLNFYTPQNSMNERRISTQYGSFNTWKISFSDNYKNEKHESYSNIAHLHSDGWRQNSKYNRTSLLTSNTLKYKSSSLNFLLLLTNVQSGIPSSLGKTAFKENPEIAAANWNAVGGYKRYFRGVAAITWQNRLSDKISNKLIVFGRGIDSYERRPFNNLDDASVGAGLRNKITIHAEKMEIVAGTELITERYTWKLDTGKVLINRNREARQQVNIFTTAYYHPAKSLIVSVAAALNYVYYKMKDLYAENGDQGGRRSFPLIFSPRIGINYSTSEQMTFFISAGQGFSMPSPEETLLPEGDVNRYIRHEKGWQIEAGTRLSLLDKRLQLDATWYRIWLSDLLITKRVTEDIFTGINAGRTNHAGIEIALRSRILKLKHFPGSFNADFSYTKSVNRFTDFTDNGISYKNNELPGIPSEIFSFQSSWKPLEWIGLYFDLRYDGRQFLNDANTLKYGSYYLMNTRITLDFSVNENAVFSFYAGVNNLNNREYASMLIVNAVGFESNEPRYYYPGLPRNGYAGMSISF